VIRTLDIGGDKPLPYIDVGEEANPFLGWRGLRLTLERRDLLETQLRAIVRASPGHKIEILLPMVSTLDELRQVKQILGPSDLPVGVMIETPAAVMIADDLAREAAFFSIGTNDLAQYVMAADRTNPRVAALANPLQPAVLRMMKQSIAAGRAAGIPVTLCGELAADTKATALLLDLGFEEFSVSAALIPELKLAISRL
jgi:phosphocarrier protein FPr